MQHLVAPVQKANKQLKLFFCSYSLVIPGIAAFLICFVLSFVSGSFIIQPQPTKAVTGLSLVGTPTMSLSTDSSAVNLNITPTQSGTLASASQSLTATTNVPTGYNLALSTPTTPTLATTAGSITSPTSLANNTWGYALARTGAVGVTNDFDSGYAIPTPSANSKWANPSTNAVIKNTSAAAANDSTTIYYGAKVDTTQASGTYSNTVRYTATANLSSIPSPTIVSITPSSGTTAGGTAIAIVGTGFAVNDESVTTAVTVGGSACTGVSISSNTPITGQDTIYCNTPAHTAGAVNVTVTTWSNTTTSANGYTYIAPANVTFVSPNQASTIAGTESGAAFTVVGSGFTGATSVTIGGTACQSFQVVSDTHIFCKAPNTINTTGNKAIAVMKTGIANTGTVNITYSSTAYPTFQSGSAYANCTTTAQLYRDSRDSQLYYVKKMPDNKCWMVDNLKYANFGDFSQETGKFLTVDGTNTQSTANSDIAKYVDPGADSYCTGSANMPTNTNTRCGLLYNWYAATNGTGTYAQSTPGTNVTGNICPANFRLPSGMSDGSTATGNGTSYDAADFAVLNASMNAGTLTTPGVTTSSYYAGWQPSGVWGGVFSGYRSSIFISLGSYGYFWSSTVSGWSGESNLIVFDNNNVVYPDFLSNKETGIAVRCVMEDPTPAPPTGSDPGNISSTNPAVLDVYPTTGWAGDTVAISSNALFTSVSAVTIGGTACTAWGVVNSSLVTCKLPAKTAGTTNDIVVTNNGTNVTPASTYGHMRITYFNPSSSTVSIGGITYNYYSSSFTSANCLALSVNNSVITSTPAASMAYFRDTRNNQTYKVKKMADGKCWMVDNLKYISSDMTFNGGDHLNNGGTTAFNTVDESSTQSTANSDKRFYNNPMSNSYCYGAANMPTNSLTRCGYQYNWYAATNGTGTYAQSTSGTNVTGNICPANFRLPSAMSDGSTATGNGTSYNAADFAVLNASMNSGSLVTGSTSNYYTNWQPSGAWGGVFSGYWTSGLGLQGSYGYFWSSMVDSATYARRLRFNSSDAIPGNGYGSKWDGFPVRCVLP